MFLVTGASGFIGSHLVERLDSPRASGAVPGAPHAVPRAICRAPSSRTGDLARGEGLDDALRRRGLRHPPGRRHQGAARGGLLRRQRPRHREPGRARWPAAPRASFTSAAWPPPARVRDGKPLDEDAPPAPVIALRQVEARRRAHRPQPCPAPSSCGRPWSTGRAIPTCSKCCSPSAAAWCSKSAGGERWFSAIYVPDLADGSLAAATASRRPRANLLPHTSRAALLDRILRRRGRAS